MMRTVAEAMIGANSAVAKRISEAFPAAALLRRHPPPRVEAFAEVKECCRITGSLTQENMMHAQDDLGACAWLCTSSTHSRPSSKASESRWLWSKLLRHFGSCIFVVAHPCACRSVQYHAA